VTRSGLTPSATPADLYLAEGPAAKPNKKASNKTGKRGRAIVDGGPGTAARSLAALGAMPEWAAHPAVLGAGGRALVHARACRRLPPHPTGLRRHNEEQPGAKRQIRAARAGCGRIESPFYPVMAGLDPWASTSGSRDAAVDARVKPGHDEKGGST
jgi:hypothetical protein